MSDLLKLSIEDIDVTPPGVLLQYLMQAHADLMSMSKRYADAKARLDYATSKREILFAKIKSEKEGNNAERERAALIDPKWQSKLDELLDEKSELYRIDLEYKGLQRFWDTIRSALSQQKHEWKREGYGGERW